MRVYIIDTPGDGFSDVYKTINTGFPSARVHKIDNFLKNTHHNIIAGILNNIATDEPIVFCDPDTIFYGDVQCELEKLEGIWLAGRLIPNYWNEVVEANEIKRLHTSLLYFGAPKTMMNYLNSIYQHRHFPLDYFAPFMYYLNQTKLFYDTCANLFHILPKEKQFILRPDQLDLYTHLGCGSILDYVIPKLSVGRKLFAHHELARDQKEYLRYLWKEQELYYKSKEPRL